MASKMSVTDAARQAISEYNLIEYGETVLAAVSGGADSVCLLYVLCALKRELGIKVICAHLNHGIRGASADADEEFVGELCKKLGVKFYSKKTDVLSLAKASGETTEEAGRTARYAFFDEIARKHKIDKIATAHNKNDNIETVLMRIIRGTGIDGLGGIPIKRDGGIIRPLLNVSRSEIEAFCAENGIAYRTDETNSSLDYTRNKIRLELLPFLEKEFSPSALESINRLSQTAREDADFLNSYAERLYKRLGNPLPGKKPTVIHCESLKMLERAIKVRIVRIAAKEAGCENLSKVHIENVLALLNSQTGAATDLPCGVRAQVNYGWIEFSKNVKAAQNLSETFGGGEKGESGKAIESTPAAFGVGGSAAANSAEHQTGANAENQSNPSAEQQTGANVEHQSDANSAESQSGANAEKQSGANAENPTAEGSKGSKAYGDLFCYEASVGESIYIEEIDKTVSLREEKKGYKPKINEQTADLERLSGCRCEIRSRRRGDRMVCFKDGRTKKIKSILIDNKVERANREKIPLLTANAEIVMIIGSRVSEKYKTNNKTERVLVISYGKGRRVQGDD